MINAAKPVIGKEELNEVWKVFKTGWLGMGDRVYKFETELKTMFGRDHVICVNTGTTAIHLALSSLGIGPGDEVIVPSLTFIATVQPVLNCGAKPVFCDVELDDLNMSVSHLKTLITKKTKAIIPVHYGGQPCDMDQILAIAKKNRIRVIEDAAHAFGSSYKRKLIGSFGDITCFSFDPIKNLTCGEGGAVVTQDNALAQLMIKKRILGIDKDTWNRYKHKRSWFYEVDTTGFRYHMSNINAAIGLAQLTKFKRFSEQRRKIACFYDKELSGIPGLALLEHDYKNIVPFNYTVLAEGRDSLMKHLEERGVGVVINYIPNHIQKLFSTRKVKLPNTEYAYERIVSLPLYAGITQSQARQVVAAVRSFFES